MTKTLPYILSKIAEVAQQLDVDPRFLTKAEFFDNCDDVTDWNMRKYGGFTKLRQDAAHTHGVQSFVDGPAARGVELRNNYVRSLERKANTVDYLSDKLLDGVSRIFQQNPIQLPTQTYLPPVVKNHDRMLTLLWSDLHFGVFVDPREVFNSKYDWKVAARRIAKCCEQASSWKPEHRANTALQVVLNGDILHGVIHLTEANMAEAQEQIWGATAILTQALSYLRTKYSSVNILCLPGNHDRMNYRGNDRALAQRWNSLAHSVFMGLKIWFRQDPGVKFDIPMSGMGTYETPGGHLVLATHGDTEPSTSNVGKSFDVSKTSQSILKMNATRVFGKKIEVVLFGHWHQPSYFMLQDGTYCIVNGSTLGSDSYAQNGVGIFDTMPAQVMFESVKGFPVGDFRVIQLKDADNDHSLDNIINVPNIEQGGLIHIC